MALPAALHGAVYRKASEQPTGLFSALHGAGTSSAAPHCEGMELPSDRTLRPRHRLTSPVRNVLWPLVLWANLCVAGVNIEFEGLDADLSAAARASLDLAQYAERDVSAVQVERMMQRGQEQIRAALEPYGYYNARVAGQALPPDEKGNYRVVYRVERGDPVIVREERIEVQGPGGELPQIKKSIRSFQPRPGERLDHGSYEGSKSRIDETLKSAGFFDADLQRHKVAVSRAASTADIDLAWNGGERYRFGAVQFTKSQFPEDFLRRYVPWKADDFYSTEQLLTFQQRLVDADYFSTVSVQPDLDQKADGTVPIEALVIPAKRTVYSAGAYLSTDSGPGGELGVERRWLNQRGHKAGAQIEYSQRLQELSTSYRIPRPGARNRNYTFAAGYRDEETDSSRSRTARLGASETLDRWHGYTRTLSLQYLNGDFEIADEQRSSSLLYAEALLTRKRANDVLFPTRGYSLTYGLRLAQEGVLSDTSLAQLRAEAKWIRPVSKKSRAILRAAAGAMTVRDFDALPPELRFFAGGDRSVRGFDYQQIGETNATGGVIGGKYLVVASTEYEYYFLRDWGGATFVDAGDAFNSQLHANVSVGLGVRWRSPVGLVRLDVAVPVQTELKDSWRIHIVIGPDL
jgi:translocation and assembly module TamA